MGGVRAECQSDADQVNLTLTSFLLSFWQRGALMGAAADEAFFVKCDDENNPPGSASRDVWWP